MYAATIKFADGNTRYNPIGDADQTFQWLTRYDVYVTLLHGDLIVSPDQPAHVTSVDVEYLAD